MKMEPLRRQTTDLVLSGCSGDEEARSRLFTLLYEELRSLARRIFSAENQQRGLQPTALVHEVFLRLVDAERLGSRGKTYFMGAAASEMRRCLVDEAKAGHAQKRGGKRRQMTLHDSMLADRQCWIDVLDLEEALIALNKQSMRGARQTRIFEMHFFGNMTHAEIGERLNLAAETVRKDWAFARAWLRSKLHSHRTDNHGSS